MIKITREINGHITETLEFSELSELIAYEAHNANEKLVADELIAEKSAMAEDIERSACESQTVGIVRNSVAKTKDDIQRLICEAEAENNDNGKIDLKEARKSFMQYITDGLAKIPKDEPETIDVTDSDAGRLWGMLDDIDTLSDSIKSIDLDGYKRFFLAAIDFANKRHLIFESDGRKLFKKPK
jgi:hypothetical protein